MSKEYVKMQRPKDLNVETDDGSNKHSVVNFRRDLITYYNSLNVLTEARGICDTFTTLTELTISQEPGYIIIYIERKSNMCHIGTNE
jgi:hypothetical protein